MIHYSCDLCKRLIEPVDDLRYVVKVEVYAAMDSADDAIDDDQDDLAEMQEILQRMESDDPSPIDGEQIGDDVYQELRFDLCPECRRKFLRNPLGRDTAKQFDFSKN